MKLLSVSLFIVFWIGLIVVISALNPVTPDLNGDGGYEPCGGFGHPLYQDC